MSEAELERAKSAAVSSVLMNLESRAVVAEDIGRQVLTYGHRWAWRGWGGGQRLLQRLLRVAGLPQLRAQDSPSAAFLPAQHCPWLGTCRTLVHVPAWSAPRACPGAWSPLFTPVPLPVLPTRRKPVGEFVQEIRGLKASDLSGAVSKLLKSAPSMAVLGDIAHVPRYDQVAKRFA